jgi:hypothetical protein
MPEQGKWSLWTSGISDIEMNWKLY